MPDFSTPEGATFLIAAAVVVLYLISWFMTAGLGPASRRVTRGLLTVAGLAAIVGAALFGPYAQAPRSGLGAPPAAEKRVAEQPVTAPGRYEREASAPASPPAAKPAPVGPQPPAPRAPEPTQQGASRSADAAPDSAAAPRTLSEQASPGTVGGAAPATAEPYQVVPIFYGTDRLAEDNARRAQYGAVRAKRLELGRAMVTIPKNHQTPLIERPWAYKIPFTSVVVYQEKEDPEKHFTISEAKVLTREAFIAAMRAKLAESKRFENHALVFVHGFNTTFDWAVFRAAQISYDLKFDGATFAYSWPSRGSPGPTDYNYDRDSAAQAQTFLEDFLKLVVKESGAKTVSIIAHSMGNQALLPVLREIKRLSPDGPQISQVILAAPDVDRDIFEVLAAQINGVAKGVTLFAAANDWALRVSRTWAGNVPRAGDVPVGGPVIVPGVDTIDVSSTSTEFLALGHNGFAEKSALLNDIELLIQTGERPPEKRVPILQRITTDRGAYWKYP